MDRADETGPVQLRDGWRLHYPGTGRTFSYENVQIRVKDNEAIALRHDTAWIIAEFEPTTPALQVPGSHHLPLPRIGPCPRELVGTMEGIKHSPVCVDSGEFTATRS